MGGPGSGGKRPGAGRKQLLPFHVQLTIAAACENAQDHEAKNRIWGQHKSRTKEIQLERVNIDKQTRRFASPKLALKARAFSVSTAKIANLGGYREYPSPALRRRADHPFAPRSSVK
jgi:hypothetical protein